jgi:LmbE family N-acetylglucosaminyl deacetylase
MMLGVHLDVKPGIAPRILCLGAHSDDIEIGCGGTLLRLMKEYSNLHVRWIVFSAVEQRAVEAHTSACILLRHVTESEIVAKDFREGFFPYIGAEIKDYFEQLKQQGSPHLIFTHYRHDLHQDHRLLSELTWNTFRDHLILEYEIPKYDGDLGTPNCYVGLDERTCQSKVRHLMTHFGSQAGRDWFTEDTFMALLRLRGTSERSFSGELEPWIFHSDSL